MLQDLLNILRVNLCNCCLSVKNIKDIEDYIENKSDSIDLGDFKLLNLDVSLNKNYNIRKDLFDLLDEEKKDEAKFKRILNVFLLVGGPSLFRMINGRFYNEYETVKYLMDLDEKEMLLNQVIRISNNYEIVINVLEDLLHPDEKMLTKAFLTSEKDYERFVNIILMCKYNFKLPNEAEELLQNYVKDGLTKGFALGSMYSIIQFLYYANESRAEFKELITNALNNGKDNVNAFDRLVRLINKNNPSLDIYEFVQSFNINKSLYVLRLANQYYANENKEMLKELNELYNRIPLVFSECLDFPSNKDNGDFEKFIIAFIIFENTKTSSALENMHKFIRKIFMLRILAAGNGFSKLSLLENDVIIKYILEGKDKNNIDKCLLKIEKVTGSYYLGHNFITTLLKIIFSTGETKLIIYRLMEVLLITEKYDAAASVVDAILKIPQESYINFADKLVEAGVDETHLIFTADKALNQYTFKSIAKIKEYLSKLSKEGNDKLKSNLVNLDIQVKEHVLIELFHCDKEKNLAYIVGFLTDTSKRVRDKIVELLGNYELCKEAVIEQLKSKKAATRESATRILLGLDMREYIDVIEKFAEVEKNEKTKMLLLTIVNCDFLDEDSLESAESISSYCKNMIQKLSYSAPEWVSLNNTKALKYKDGEYISPEVLAYICSKYSVENIVERNTNAEKIILNCDKYDLDQIGHEILCSWISNGANTQEKWVLSMIAAFGGFNVINTLKNQIELWSKGSRGSIACDAVKALALNGSNEALMVIDIISRKIKHKQIKKAAEEAFVFAATLLNLTGEELADRVIPDLEFDKRGQRVFDYGNRSFIVTLQPDFTFRLEELSGKVIKTLPKPNKSDDESKANSAIEEFKVLKKQIKTIVETQSSRLEMALAGNRLWKKVDWEKLFVENPIMHNFSLGLVWGVYVGEKLIQTFRYMEDGSFNTKDEEEYVLEEKSLIGLVHPLEISAEDLATWTQQFEDYEIVQPISQLSRKIYIINEEEKEMKWIERFGGTKIIGLSLVGKLSKFGWYRGSVQDAGGYYEFYKEDAKIGIGAEITFEGLSIGLESEETTIYLLKFYKAKTVERGSYVYDEVSDENIIIPSKVPKRFFSEILYEVDRTLEAATGTAGNWRNSIR